MSKQALVVGIDYVGHRAALDGCANDAYAWARLLSSLGYEVSLLVDDAHPDADDRAEWEQDHGAPLSEQPTRAAILRNLVRLVTSNAEKLAFVYSGHGTQVADRGGDEWDGKDEVLCPSDMDASGYITDDALYGVWQMLRPFQRVFAVHDCCSSGTSMDLPYQLYDRGGARYRFVQEHGRSPTPGRVVLLSGCEDDDYAVETSETGTARGALSVAAIETLSRSGGQLSMQQFARTVRDALRRRGIRQIAQLSCGREALPRDPVF